MTLLIEVAAIGVASFAGLINLKPETVVAQNKDCGAVMRNVMFNGNSMRGDELKNTFPGTNQETCRQSCVGTASCVAWTFGYNEPKGKPNCWLFSKLSNAQGLEGFDSGVVLSCSYVSP